MTFTIEDIKDRVLLDTLIKEEANRIFNSSTARKERSFETIYNNCSIGKLLNFIW